MLHRQEAEYAAWGIRAYILHDILNNWRMAYEQMLKGDVRYRFVIDLKSLA